MKINWKVDNKSWTINREVDRIDETDDFVIKFDNTDCTVDKAELAAMRKGAIATETAPRTAATDADLGITE